jgi:putative transposase
MAVGNPRGTAFPLRRPGRHAYVEHVIRTIREEEIWPNLYATVSEARETIEGCMRYYNQERPHSALE